MFLLKLLSHFDEKQIPYVLVGGYAMAFHGIVRATVDIDLVISLKETHLKKAEEILHDMGLESRIPVRAQEMAHFHEKFHKEKNLVAWSFVDPRDPTRVVDLLITPPIRSVKTTRIKVHGQTLVVATLASIVEMKKKAGRAVDLADIVRIKEYLDEKKES